MTMRFSFLRTGLTITSLEVRRGFLRIDIDRHWLRPNELVEVSIFGVIRIAIYWPKRAI